MLLNLNKYVLKGQKDNLFVSKKIILKLRKNVQSANKYRCKWAPEVAFESA